MILKWAYRHQFETATQDLSRSMFLDSDASCSNNAISGRSELWTTYWMLWNLQVPDACCSCSESDRRPKLCDDTAIVSICAICTYLLSLPKKAQVLYFCLKHLKIKTALHLQGSLKTFQYAYAVFIHFLLRYIHRHQSVFKHCQSLETPHS